MQRIPFDQLRDRIERVMLALGLAPERAALSARLTAETDRDGVSTHGIARLPRFAESIRTGMIVTSASPTLVTSVGAIERWRGHRGPGNLAAHACMNRAMELAEQHGLGCVALADTAHWMRGGTYGWQAAEAGFAALCWTNTLPNLPPWGASTTAIGNNPLVIAVPHLAPDQTSQPVVLDMAMSQFSYGCLDVYSARGEQLPFPGGYDAAGNLTTDPDAINRSQRSLPIGYWKGSGLSFVLDVLAATLSGGLATHQVNLDPVKEVGQSQIFLAIAPQSLATLQELSAITQGALDALHAAKAIDPNDPPRYPGERSLRMHEESIRLGVACEDAALAAFVKLEQRLGQ